MIIDCVSDLHGHYPHLEGGDLLIVAGDLTARDTIEEHTDTLEWLSGLNYKMKVIVPGNHDNFLMDNPNFYSKTDIKYLIDCGTEFKWIEIDYTKLAPKNFPSFRQRKLKIWGSPWTKTFPGINPLCKAFTMDTEDELDEKWALIPDDVDILITHGPAYGILDKNISGEHCGSRSLDGYWEKHLDDHLERVKPTLHIFGHIHEDYGIDHVGSIICVNASLVNERYQPVNKPVRIEL